MHATTQHQFQGRRATTAVAKMRFREKYRYKNLAPISRPATKPRSCRLRRSSISNKSTRAFWPSPNQSASAIKPISGSLPHSHALSAPIPIPIHITCALPNRARWVLKSAMSLRCRSAVIITNNCIKRVTKWPGGMKCKLSHWRSPNSFGTRATRRQHWKLRRPSDWTRFASRL